MGRFVNEDPVRDGLNWYAYANNNPVRFVDPFGHAPVDFIEYIRAQGGTVENIASIDGRARVAVTVNGVTQHWFLNSGVMEDFDINARFGFASILTNADREAGVGISIILGQLYKDFTVPINTALSRTADTAEGLHKYYLDSLTFEGITSGQSVFLLGVSYGWFYDQVKTRGSWDIKVADSWNTTIAENTYPGQYDTQFAYMGTIMTPESMGNYTYGYIGAALGIPLATLFGGSFAVAGVPQPYNKFPYIHANPDFHNEMGDWVHISSGFVAYGIR